MIRLTDEERGALGARLYRARREAGLTQEQMAHEIGISLQAYGRWETGKVPRPDPDNLATAAEVLGVQVNWLVSGENTLSSDPLEELRDDLAALSAQIEGLTSQVRRLRDSG